MDRPGPPSLVIPFLEAQTFFVTGVTGFLGKIFLHKLLASCPNIKDKSIYVLVRGKKELSAEARFEKDILEASLLYHPATVVGQRARQKIKVIEGDIAKSKLGMSAADYQEITEKCTALIHLAATTNFNENLRLSVELNVLGSRRMLDLAKKCPGLVSIVHCSTCYVNAPRFGSGEVREKVYPITFDPYAMTDKIVAMTVEEADLATPQIIGPHPNTYTFTKNIAEHILLEEKGEIPYAIVRPSIIGGAWEEPLEGWVDSYIGPAGLALAAGLGALRTMRGSSDTQIDLVPVDLVANALLSTSYHTAVNPPGPRMPIYHISTGVKNPHTWGILRGCVLGHFSRRPSSKKQVAKPWAWFAHNQVQFEAAHFLAHVVPAAIADGKDMITGRPATNLTKIAQLKSVLISLEYFTTHEWNFGVQNMCALYESLNETDAKIFNFDLSPLNIDWEMYYVRFCNGLKKYLLKELSPHERQYLISAKL